MNLPSAPFNASLKLLALVGLLVMAGTDAIRAQSFVVESTSIENGQVNVGTVVDISITFSKPISVIGLPDLGGVLPIEIDFGSDDEECAVPPALVAVTPGGCIGSWSLENNDATLVLENVTLLADVPQTLLVLLAVSTDGDLLDRPISVRFSTGDSLPQGSVSGNVSSGDLDVGGAIVTLGPADPLGLVSGEDTVGLDALVAFADAGGSYTIPFVPDGVYLPLGIQIDFSALDGLLGAASKVAVDGLGIGLYDSDGDRISDLTAVSGGAETSGVDLNLSSSGDKIVESADIVLNALATEGATNARLSLAAGAPIGVDGATPFWTMLMTDITTGRGWVSLTMGDVALAPARIDTVEDIGELIFLFASAMFTDYANSDQAVDWFNDAGGAEFLAEFPDAIGLGLLMDRALLDLLLEILEGGEITFGPSLEVWGKVLRQEYVVDALTGLFSKQQSLEAWIVAFVGVGEDLALHLVAMGDDGTPLLVVGSSPAAVNQSAADAAAAAWDANAYLVSVNSLELPVTAGGSALAWDYSYYSASSDSVLSVIVSGGPLGGVLTTSVVEKERVASTEQMIDGWIDSPEALEKADVIAASFLANHLGATSTVELSKGLQMDNPGLAIWRVIYSATEPDGSAAEKVVDLDASNGVFVAIEDEPTVPSGFALEQNYPNPFNPETVIPYHLDEAGTVSLAVFDALGRKVRLLVDGTQTSGSYRAVWNAQDDLGNVLPSGVYLYRLEAGGEVATRRMLLVK